MNTLNTLEESLFLPSNILEIQKVVSETAQKADPTKLTPLSPLEKDTLYLRDESFEEVFVSLLCRGILNFCPFIFSEKDKKFYSLWLNPENVEEITPFPEVIADLSLFMTLFWDVDRNILLSTSYQDKVNIIQTHNCQVFPQWSYSIFDFENVWNDSFLQYPIEDVCRRIYANIQELYEMWAENHYISWTYFLELDLLGESFWKRILKKVNEFLERYTGSEWEKLFFCQIRKALFYEYPLSWDTYNMEDCFYDSEKLYYSIFLKSLENIKYTFERDVLALEQYICYDRDLIKKEIHQSTRILIENIQAYIALTLSKIVSTKWAWKIVWVKWVKSFLRE